ncbi:MAG: N-acetylmuramoyl-L-alanine amidase [Opitutaceae bacterium]|nr:N-acetylmuramoyl-L-alanine amidase [Opitutaceae bacterium]
MFSSRRQFLQQSLLATTGLLLGGPALLAAGKSEITYTVKTGDTLSAIASHHGTQVAELKRRNQLKSDRILVGQKLVVPVSGAADPALAAVVAATQSIRVDRDRWRYIVIHHSGIEDGNAKAYDAGHRRRGMEHGLAYHFVIGTGRDSGEGEIEIGPRWTRQLRGGHVRRTEVNDTGIGICLVGNFEKRRPSAKQLQAAFDLVDWLRAGQVSPKHQVTVHRWVDRNHTVCPGRNFPFTTLKRRYNIA